MNAITKLSAVLFVALAACGVEQVDEASGNGADEPAAPDTTTPDAGTPPPDAPTPDAKPATCADVRAQHASAVDGDYKLFIGGDAAKPWTAHCVDMNTQPKEYLSLVNTWFGQNAATFPTSGAIGGTSVMTSYTKLRIDPATLAVDIDDQRFATSQGSHAVPHTSIQVTSMPYGVAMNCNDFFSAGANINLGGTPFRYDGAFEDGAAVTADSAHQVFDIIGSGWGWNGPLGIGDPIGGNAGAVLTLAYIQ